MEGLHSLGHALEPSESHSLAPVCLGPGGIDGHCQAGILFWQSPAQQMDTSHPVSLVQGIRLMLHTSLLHLMAVGG